MKRLEAIDAGSWEEFVASGTAVLVLGKSDCPACASWTEELEAHLEDPSRGPQVRFGKILLDTPGLAGFKRANPWVAELDVLPHTEIYVAGQRAKGFAGGGVGRLDARLRRLAPDAGTAGGGG
jgi:hypothetical protein